MLVRVLELNFTCQPINFIQSFLSLFKQLKLFPFCNRCFNSFFAISFANIHLIAFIIDCLWIESAMSHLSFYLLVLFMPCVLKFQMLERVQIVCKFNLFLQMLGSTYLLRLMSGLIDFLLLVLAEQLLSCLFVDFLGSLVNVGLECQLFWLFSLIADPSITELIQIKLIKCLVNNLKIALIKEKLIFLIEISNLYIFFLNFLFIVLKHLPLICSKHLLKLNQS